MKKIMTICLGAVLTTAACSSPSSTPPPPASDTTRPHVDSAVDTVKQTDSIIKG